MTRVQEILDQAIAGRRLAADEGLALLESPELAALGEAADAVTRRLHPEPYRTYNIDRNINYTNICLGGCRFCASSRQPGDADGYVTPRDDLLPQKIEETIALGGNQILLARRPAPRPADRLVRGVARATSSGDFPQINVHGFGPPEIDHIAKLSGLPVREVLERLQGGRLGQPARRRGGNPRRSRPPGDQPVQGRRPTDWLEVCRTWHGLGGRGSATMMFGHVETLAERIEHLERLRALAGRDGRLHGLHLLDVSARPYGLGRICRKLGAFEYLKTLAVSRLYLDNFANLQASWVTQGLAIGQMALRFGANDMGSLMIEENVVAAAGTALSHHRGRNPRRRSPTPATSPVRQERVLRLMTVGAQVLR